MSKQKRLDTIIIAHPDDETLFFGGLIMSKANQFRIVCVTDGNADGQGAKRVEQIKEACRILKVKELIHLGFPDKFEKRLDLVALRTALRQIPKPARVFTHGPIGEYGHPHHQDVCRATHEVFKESGKVYSVAHNCQPDLFVKLTSATYRKKMKILKEIYFSETSRFLNFVPATFAEGYTEFSMGEILALYDFLSTGKTLDRSKLDKYAWYADHLEIQRERLQERPF